MVVTDEMFLGRVGHDLRGELNTIVTGTHYLLRYESNLGQVARQMLDRINNAGQRMRRLLDEFDDAVWIEEGKPSDLKLEPCQIDLLIKSALDRLTPAIQRHEVAVDLQLPPDMPSFEADPRLAGLALEYVLDFALARSRKKALHVTATLRDGQAALSISDEGGAISEEARDRIFDPFALQELLPRPEPGQRLRERLGLGLAIARGILAAHGVSIAVEDASDGQGITFRLTWNRAGQGAHPEGAPANAASPAGGAKEQAG